MFLLEHFAFAIATISFSIPTAEGYSTINGYSRGLHRTISWQNSPIVSAMTADGNTAEPQPTEDTGSNDILNSPAFLKRKLEVIEEDLRKINENIDIAKAALAEGKEIWGDKFADLDKERSILQERMIKQAQESGGAATIEVAGKIVEVLDNFDRAFATVTPESDSEKEIESLYKNAGTSIINVFDTLGVKKLETIGTEFDYELHNAVMMRPSEEYEEGYVIDELAKGYVFGENQLIRAAMVIVST